MRKHALLLLAAYVAAFFAFTLAPYPAFGPLPSAKPVISVSSGIRFLGPRLLVSEEAPPGLNAPTFRRGTFSIELEVTPWRSESMRQSRIVAYSKNPSFQNWIVAQDGLDLLVRHRGRQVTFPGFFEVARRERLVLTLDPAGVRADRLGRATQTQPWTRSHRGWDARARLALGNEVTGDRAWNGELHKLRIYRRPLRNAEIATALEQANAPLPDGFVLEATAEDRIALMDERGTTIPLQVYQWPGYLKLSRLLATEYILKTTPKDLAINIAMGMPVGLLLAIHFHRWGGRRILLAALLTQLLISFVAEAGQMFAYSRYASLVDLAANAAGAVCGTLLALQWKHGPRPIDL